MAKVIKVCFFGGCSRSPMDPCITSCSISLQRGKSEVRHLPPIAPGKYNQSIMLFRVVQVTKSLQDPLEVGNSLLGISHNVRE